MQAYSKDFARVYNLKWSAFADHVAPFIQDFYRSTPQGKAGESILDLCCGTGHLAVHFLNNGFKVVGVDLSEHMLYHARERCGKYIDSGQSTFINADASDFTFDGRFGLTVSMYDSLNHFENEEALINCFKSVYAVTDGYFIFDLNTRLGLKRWNSISVNDSSEDTLVISRGFFDEQSDKALMKFTGFERLPEGTYNRFEETVYNTVFQMEDVRKALLKIGWKEVYFARVKALSDPITEPEKEPRVFFVARK